jgi:hypothetical protein
MGKGGVWKNRMGVGEVSFLTFEAKAAGIIS